jgi:hypothetical protein
LFDWYWPLVQPSQLVSRASSDDAVPTLQSMHLLCSMLGWYLPGMQFKHAVVPGFDWYWPFKHRSHTFVRATVDEALPKAHCEHSAMPF